ncbi:putative membrane protein [Oceanobacillus picturae]|uniref:Membrane protein n=1 Tax=Oceanobacillus picturae TaxID=171693 RepID=W9AAD4_9BACI|nr:DUF418 domain-containing protein [Oceanobacillus picturae]CDO02699.1 putative membrane protein [Oceanobacillus picturae]
MAQYPSPLKETNRLQWIDEARGFAIFGIFVVNIGAFNAPYFLYGGEETAWTSSIDHTLRLIIDIFFQASFYTLFSLLFGFGMQLMKERLEMKSLSAYPILGRRLGALICFGLVHAFLIWHGDILLTYGLIGLLLLAFLNVRGRTMLSWAFLLMGMTVGLLSISLYQFREYIGQPNLFAAEQALSNYQSGSIIQVWEQNYVDWLYANEGISYLLLIGTLLPLFLVGMFIARQRWLHEPKKHQATLRRLWFISLLMFAGLKAGPYLFGNPAWFSMIQDNIGGAFSALFYIISITFLSQMEGARKLLLPFRYVGRMALSNYITQSLVCFLVFYLFRLYGAMTPVGLMLMVLVVYSMQAAFSKWWLTHYRFGPLEWLWRSITYKRIQKLRRTEQEV